MSVYAIVSNWGKTPQGTAFMTKFWYNELNGVQKKCYKSVWNLYYIFQLLGA